MKGGYICLDLVDPAADREEEWEAPEWAAWAALEWEEDAEEALVDRLRRDVDMEVADAALAASDAADRS